jgi:hypothetical protein
MDLILARAKWAIGLDDGTQQWARLKDMLPHGCPLRKLIAFPHETIGFPHFRANDSW